MPRHTEDQRSIPKAYAAAQDERAAQAWKVARMKPTDPLFVIEKRLLDMMTYNSTVALVVDAMAVDVADAEWLLQQDKSTPR